MGETLDALHILQEIETRLSALRGKIEAKKRKARTHHRVFQKQETVIAEKQEALRSQQMLIDSMDLDVAKKDSELNKHREALNQAKTNKEYAAILTAINTEKADSTKLESHQLELMTALDGLREDFEESKKQLERLSDQVRKADDDARDQENAYAAEIAELLKKREAAAASLSRESLETFDRIATRHDGQAMAPIAVGNAKRKEYCCGGCNMSLTLEQVISVKTRDDVACCPSCGMILYLTADTLL
jgi:uncharacterized protein